MLRILLAGVLSLHIGIIWTGYIDEKGFYRDSPAEESLRYDRVHVYRGYMFAALERLWLCKKSVEHLVIDWEILRDEGIEIKEFDKIVDDMDKMVTKEIEIVENMIQVDPRTAKIIQPVNQSTVDEIAKYYQRLICCLEEQTPANYARERFVEMIRQLRVAEDNMHIAFRNVTTSIADIKKKHNV